MLADVGKRQFGPSGGVFGSITYCWSRMLLAAISGLAGPGAGFLRPAPVLAPVPDVPLGVPPRTRRSWAGRSTGPRCADSRADPRMLGSSAALATPRPPRPCAGRCSGRRTSGRSLQRGRGGPVWFTSSGGGGIGKSSTTSTGVPGGSSSASTSAARAMSTAGPHLHLILLGDVAGRGQPQHVHLPHHAALLQDLSPLDLGLHLGNALGGHLGQRLGLQQLASRRRTPAGRCPAGPASDRTGRRPVPLPPG